MGLAHRARNTLGLGVRVRVRVWLHRQKPRVGVRVRVRGFSSLNKPLAQPEANFSHYTAKYLLACQHYLCTLALSVAKTQGRDSLAAMNGFVVCPNYGLTSTLL
jgi:hypothetical protein